MFKNIRRAFGLAAEEAPKTEWVAELENSAYNPYSDIQLLAGHTDIVRLVVIVDEKRMATSSDDHNAIVWSFRTGRCLHVLSGHTLPITALLVSVREQDSGNVHVLITASSDKSIRLWDIDAGVCLHTLSEHRGGVKSLTAISPSLFCSGGRDVCIWDFLGTSLNRPRLAGRINRSSKESNVHTVLTLREQRLVAASDACDLEVYSWSQPAYEPTPSATMNPHRCLSHHRDVVRTLVRISDGLFASGSLDGAIVLWTSHTLSAMRVLNSHQSVLLDPTHSYPFNIHCLHPIAEKYLVAAVGNGFMVFDVATGELLAERQNAHRAIVTHIISLHGGARLVTCSQDATIRLWGADPAKLSPDMQYRVDTGEYDPVLDLLLGITPDKGTSKKRERARPASAISSSGPINSVQSPSAALARAPACLGELIGHSVGVNAIAAFTDDSFASCGSDSLVILWKDGGVQSRRRNELAKMMLIREREFSSTHH